MTADRCEVQRKGDGRHAFDGYTMCGRSAPVRSMRLAADDMQDKGCPIRPKSLFNTMAITHDMERLCWVL